VENDLLGVPRDRNDRNEVDEGNSSLPVVDQRRLAFLSLRELSLEVRDGDVVGVSSSGSLGDFSVGSCRREREREREESAKKEGDTEGGRKDRTKGKETRKRRKRRTLQESTVLSDDILSFVAGEAGEGRRSVDDRAVEFSDIL